MKWAHWVSIMLGAVIVGLTSAEAELTGTALLIVKVIVAMAGATLPALGITSPSATKPSPLLEHTITTKEEIK